MGNSAENERASVTVQGRILGMLLSLFGALSVATNRRVGAAIGWLFRVIPNRNRRVATTNLKLCFPESTDKERADLLHRHLRATGMAMTELGLFWRKPRDKVLGLIAEIEGEEHLTAAVAAGNGVLLAAPHLGAWELLCHYLSTTAPTVVLYREPRDAGIEDEVNKGRSRFGARCVRAGGRGVRELIRSLRHGEIIGILPDQQPKRGQGEFAPFFGINAFTMTLLSRLAARTRAPVIFGVVQRLEGSKGYRLVLEPADTAISSDDVAISTRALNQQIEALVRQCPEQYQWGYKRFSMRPTGEPRLYP